MKRINKNLLIVLILGISFGVSTIFAQPTSKSEEDKKVSIGGYGQIDFNKPFIPNQNSNSKLDIHRMVLLFGYEYNKRLSFLTEIEFEHVTEVYVEQAYLNYAFSPSLNFRAGLLLIPMGIINEYHEPSSFNGVERPLLDTRIIPSTWREIGMGLTGQVTAASLTYQLYLVNGFASYDGSAKLKGVDALRGGRQKGAESFMSSPNLSAKISYHGILGLELGLSGYFGKTQSSLYNGIDFTNKDLVQKADSSVVGVSMMAFDYRYRLGNFRSRGQVVYSNLSNTDAYNKFTGRDLGSALFGYYAEVSYVIPFNMQDQQHEVEPFVRWEHYNTHFDVAGDLTANDSYSYNGIGVGVGYRFHENAVFKIDYILYRNGTDTLNSGVFNMGVGVNF
jgi:hypothetical protein